MPPVQDRFRLDEGRLMATCTGCAERRDVVRRVGSGIVHRDGTLVRVSVASFGRSLARDAAELARRMMTGRTR